LFGSSSVIALGKADLKEKFQIKWYVSIMEAKMVQNRSFIDVIICYQK